ncbi:MAG: excinuclease ABC subunit UvrA [Flavobacteriaceae bacterium]|nr:excinuclease ABC subunit UvrA [Flavobacteriaceae bacterium]MCY4267114.1 excinuclease ABC subunit UvrA [Flavobacteriaceae bacterium]
MLKLDQYNPKSHLIIKGAQVHNLQNIDVVLPHKKLIVITGLSGSGKTSLAFDTIYAEGQRRFVESLSSYNRQFMERINKPKVDFIKGLAPTIAVEQRVPSGNKRSTVGTKTEIYDYLKLLYARIGKTYSPDTGEIVKSHDVTDVLNDIKKTKQGEKLAILSPIITPNKKIALQKINFLINEGYVRAYYQNKIIKLLDLKNQLVNKNRGFSLVIERTIHKFEDSYYHRLADSISTAFQIGNDQCHLLTLNTNQIKKFSKNFQLDGIDYIKPSIHFFSFNNRLGCCPKCNGIGQAYGYSESLVIPNPTLSIENHAIAPWKSEKYRYYYDLIVTNGNSANVPTNIPYEELSSEEKNNLWNNDVDFCGINKFFEFIERDYSDFTHRITVSKYRHYSTCTYCNGSRLRPETHYVKINDTSLPELLLKPIDDLIRFFESIKFSEYDYKIAKILLLEIKNRLDYLENVGLGYLTLNRTLSSLSGGESQRIQLATALGSSLVGAIYILDEPSVGLHVQDNQKLIDILKSLRDIGNTVIVVEHDRDIISNADYILDIGPEAGTKGGQVVALGPINAVKKSSSLTAKYLNGSSQMPHKKKIRIPKKFINLQGAQGNNLNNIDVAFPLNCLTIVCGVSGSGKSTLLKQTFYPELQSHLEFRKSESLKHKSFHGAIDDLSSVEYIDQHVLNRSSRSIPLTYIDAWKDIRELYASQNISKLMNYPASYFSFNTKGGRCEHCQGEGSIKIEMQFMADIKLKCDYCNGTRYKKEIRDVTFQGYSIDQVLKLTVDDAISFFSKHDKPTVANKMKPLQEVGMGYVSLGQTTSSLSGGEAQRLKLASYLGIARNKEKILFVFDEPSVGLHFHDLKKLIKSFELLIEKGHTIIVIDHNIDLIKSADYLIELGPGGGHHGGNILFQGSYHQVFEQKQSIIKHYLNQTY